MVFRKPYAFLIKHFKLIHLIITSILILLVRSNNTIFSYLNSCINDPVNRYNALDYINYSIYIFIIIAIILLFIIYLLFKHKDKPRYLYLFSIIGYIIIAIFMFILFNYFNELPHNIIDQKTIRGYRDIMLITLGFQYLIIVNMFIRTLGFDIKKFNFGKDIQELNLREEDNEEIEVDVKIDTTNIMREVRKKKRELGYYFMEYRVIILGIFAIILVIITANIYNKYKGVFKVYEQNEIVGNINHLAVTKTYYDIKNDKNYVIVAFDIFKYNKKEILNLTNMVLIVDKEQYVPNKNICHIYNELGNCYKKQYITDKVTSYIIVYEVDNLNSKSTYLLYKETYEDKFKIKLNLENY